MSTIYSLELVAPAIAGLTERQICNLVDQGQFGKWLASQISSTLEPDSYRCDSEAASEAAGASGDAEYQATQVLATLTEEQREKLEQQVYLDIGPNTQSEVLALM